MDDLDRAVETVLGRCPRVRAGEQVTVAVDERTRAPDERLRAPAAADVFVAPASKSLGTRVLERGHLAP